MNTPKTFTVAFIAALLCSTSSYAEEQQAPQHPVQMVSGGVGDDGMDSIAAIEKRYSLKLVFAQANGEYLADADVEIKDIKGNTVLNTNSSGPVLLLNLKPGTYTTSATLDGETKTQRIVVHGNGLNTYYIHLHATES